MDDIVKEKLLTILGPEHFLTDEGACRLASQDISCTSDFTVKAVMRPLDKQALASIVKICVHAGYALFPRGGGMSYTSGYLPSEEKSFSIDMSCMAKVVEINVKDMFVTVEAGCTWADLYEALKGTGLRTPYWGTLSGLKATVGGSVSQNSIFFGSGLYGTAADSVIGLEVVMADGEIITTGSAAQRNSGPFLRHYGPDLTGLFTSDSGSLGIKATITLKLISKVPHVAFTSFSFPDHASMFTAASEVSRRGLACEAFGFDPYLQAQRMKRESLAQDLKVLGNVMKSSGSVFGAIKDAAKIATAGRRYMDDVPFSFHFTTENHNQVAAQEAIAEINSICKGAGGTKIENSIPKIIRSNPFMPLNNMVGPQGERWLPVHGLVPHSKAIEMADKIEELFKKHRKAMQEQGIETGYLFTLVGSSTCVLEPVFFWPDELLDIHRHTVEGVVQKGFTDFGKRTEANNLVMSIRSEITLLFMEMGAVHLQIGKSYRYAEGIESTTLALIKALKNVLDPTNRINPGALGL